MNSNDRANLIKRINTLEGLTDKERSDLLGLLRENKTYGLVWEDKPEDVEERLREELPILTEVPERVIISEDNDAPNHILIEEVGLGSYCDGMLKIINPSDYQDVLNSCYIMDYDTSFLPFMCTAFGDVFAYVKWYRDW